MVQGGGGCCGCITAKIVFSSCFVPITSGSIAPCFPGKQGGHAGGRVQPIGLWLSERVIALPVERSVTLSTFIGLILHGK